MPPVENISVILGGAPEFRPVTGAGWAYSLCGDCPGINPPLIPYLVELRADNAPALVERVHRAQEVRQPIHFNYPDPQFNAIPQSALILAAQAVTTAHGDVLRLWVGLPPGSAADLAAA